MFRELFYIFLSYRSLVFPIMAVAAAVVPCWVIFRIYRRGRGYHLSLPRELLLLAFVVYLSGLVAVTLLPNHSARVVAQGAGGIELSPRLASLTCSPALLPSGANRGFCVRNARGNVLLFLPLGILVPLVWRRLRPWQAMQIAIATSAGIELIQYLSSAWGSYRAADINDVILNVVGAGLGLALGFSLRLLRRPPPPGALYTEAQRP